MQWEYLKISPISCVTCTPPPYYTSCCGTVLLVCVEHFQGKIIQASTQPQHVFRGKMIGDSVDNCNLAGFAGRCLQVVADGNADTPLDNIPGADLEVRSVILSLFIDIISAKLYWVTRGVGPSAQHFQRL